MRVAQVVCTNSFGGTERYVATLSAGLDRLGHHVTIFGGHPARMQEALTTLGGSVDLVPVRNLTECACRLATRRPFDLVHAHLTAAEAAATLVFPLRSRTALVSTRHIAAHRGSSAPARLVAKALRARLDGQMAISQYIASRVEGPSVVIPTGVHDKPMGAHDQNVVLIAQRLEAEKDTATALLAWAGSRLGEQGWELHIAGSGRQEPQLKQLASSLSISRSCHFLGHVRAIDEKYAEAAILLAPSTADSFGLSVVEAMASGLPVVAAAAGGHLETVGGLSDGMLFPPGDAVSAAALLRQLADDEVLRHRYGSALRECQQSLFSFPNFLQMVASWYEEVLEARAPRRHPPNHSP